MTVQVVVIGANSQYVGIPLLKALIEDHYYEKLGVPIVVLTRSAKDVTVRSDRIRYIEWQVPTDLDGVLSTADLVVNTTGSRSDWDGIADAIVRAKSSIKAYIPSDFGSDVQNAPIRPLPYEYQLKLRHVERVRKAGIKVIEVQTGSIDGIGSISVGFAMISGLNAQTNTVTFVGDPDTEYHATWNEDLGNAVACLAAFQANFSNVPDIVNIFSYAVTQRKVIDRYITQTGVKPEFLPPIPYDKAFATATELAVAGDRSFPAFIQILQVIAASGPGKGLYFTENHRELLNPGEKYFKWHQF